MPLGNFCQAAHTADMPTRNISLTAHQDAFITRLIATGDYQNASEAVRDALRALQQRREQDALRLEALRKELDLGIADLDAGNYTVVEEHEIDAYIKGLAPVKRKTRRKRKA
jgi:antitoxin ParD1/3/4